MPGETHIRQVVVAFGASQVPRETLEAAAELAAALHAEVRALMVEESWLEQVAEHPVTAELYLGSRTIQPWDRDRLRLELRARAEQTRRTVRSSSPRSAACGSRSRWRAAKCRRCSSRRGGADILSTVVACGTAGAARRRRDRDWRSSPALRSSRGFTLIHREGRIDRLPLVLYYDGSPSARARARDRGRAATGAGATSCACCCRRRRPRPPSAWWPRSSAWRRENGAARGGPPARFDRARAVSRTRSGSFALAAGAAGGRAGVATRRAPRRACSTRRPPSWSCARRRGASDRRGPTEADARDRAARPSHTAPEVSP